MLTLAVATRAETFERMGEPLAERGIAVRHVRTKERTFPVTDMAPADATGHRERRDGGRRGSPEADGRVGRDGSRLAEEFHGFDVGFVYPTRLMEGDVVDALLDVPWVNDRRAVLTSRNKAGVLARLARAGVPVPGSVLVSNPVGEAALHDAFERFAPPVVVKPNSATRGIGITTAHDLDSLLGVVDYLDLVHDFRATGDRSYLLQEFLPDARDYRVMVVSGAYAGAVERRVPADEGAGRRWKHNVHRHGAATPVDLPRDLRTLAERVATVLDVDYLGVDLLVTDDRAVVSETNARPTIDDPGRYEPDFYDRLAALIRSRAAGR